MTDMTTHYDNLLIRLERIGQLDSVSGLLGWDEQVNLPVKSAGKRAREMAVLAEVVHREATDAGLGDDIQRLNECIDELDQEQRCVLEEADKNYKRLTCLPSEFVSRRAEAQSHSYHAWTDARRNSDFSSFAPHLETQIELCLEEAAYVGRTDDAYDYFIDRHDPGMSMAVIDPLFDALQSELVPLVAEIVASPVKPPENIFRDFPEDEQRRFLHEVTEALGFDYQRGRLDVAVHPFCSGSGADTRMTTRYDKDNPLDSLFSSIHETGHALYEQGLPGFPFGTALTEAVGMAVHESQSRLWENQVGRSRAFWKHWEPKFRQRFSSRLKDVSSGELYLAVNAVKRSLIRVDADEVTYNLHIILRYTLEKRLLSGELKVLDLPDAWNDMSESLFGLRPEKDAEGVLQDVHWSGGAVSYFPSYCLGNMLAAQLWYTALDALPKLEEEFEKGDYRSLLTWLRSTIHIHGSLYNTQELVPRATGAPLSHTALIRYLKERYLPLYAG